MERQNGKAKSCNGLSMVRTQDNIEFNVTREVSERNSSAQDFALAAKSVKIRFGREESGTLPKANLKCAGFSNRAAEG